MRGLAKTFLAGLVVALGLAGGQVHAQPPGYPGGYRPPISPYLNLLRPGSNPTLNYYGLVRPQLEFRSGIQGLQQQVGTIDSQLASQGVGPTDIPATGHPVQFMNYSHYFGRSPASGSLGGSAPRVNPPLR